MAIENFLRYIQFEKRYSPHTVLAYTTDLNQFRNFMADTYEIGYAEVTHVHIRDFMVHLLEGGDSENSVNRKLSTLRSFYKYLIRQGLHRSNPVALVKSPKVPKRLPVFIDSDKMNALLDSTVYFDEGFPSLRDKLVIETLFGTGIRVSELTAIEESDIDLHEQTIKITGKRNKQRIIPLTGTLQNLLKTYLDQKSLQNFNNNSGVLFVSNKGVPLKTRSIYTIVHHYLTFVSTQEKRSPHVLRHSFATALLNRGADINAIKELLGHASLAATQVYTHNSIEKIKSIYKQAHPKA